MQRYTKDLGPGAGDVSNDDVAMLSGPGVSEVGGVRTTANQHLELAELTNHMGRAGGFTMLVGLKYSAQVRVINGIFRT